MSSKVIGIGLQWIFYGIQLDLNLGIDSPQVGKCYHQGIPLVSKFYWWEFPLQLANFIVREPQLHKFFQMQYILSLCCCWNLEVGIPDVGSMVVQWCRKTGLCAFREETKAISHTATVYQNRMSNTQQEQLPQLFQMSKNYSWQTSIRKNKYLTEHY